MTKRLWPVIIVSMLLVLCGSLFASLLSARSYLTAQLSMKKTDNANALAVALSEGDIEQIKAGLAAALFESGQVH